jgi:hypothetical protein
LTPEETLSNEMWPLEVAANRGDGCYQDYTPPDRTCERLAQRGLFRTIEAPSFLGGLYQITDAGREFLKQHAAPIGEW